MILFIVSFIAGALTVLAPCILPLLPVVLGGSAADATNRKRPYVIIASLALSVFLFTLLLKASTALINTPPSVWSYLSATILALFGLTLIFPNVWAKVVLKLPGSHAGNTLLATGYKYRGEWWGDVLAGFALGPIFTTCSPTFFVIIATVLPQSLAVGIIDLLAYIAGLSIALIIIALLGQVLVDRLGWASDPNGYLKRGLGFAFIILAVVVATGFDRRLQVAALDAGLFDITKLEIKIRSMLEGTKTGSSSESGNEASTPSTTTTTTTNTGASEQGAKPVGQIKPDKTYNFVRPHYVEMVSPSGFVNSAPFKLADIVGKKVVLIDFMTYSCINCQRTFPYLKAWYAKYKDQGFEIVGIHTPEFAFEKNIDNVREAAMRFGLAFPLVLDNEYKTWNAYQNQYWPHKYLIDIHGNVIYDHIGEGGYDETEEKIVAALMERKKVLGEGGEVSTGVQVPAYTIETSSPETYFGASRNQNFGNGEPGKVGQFELTLPLTILSNRLYLEGKWDIQKEYASNMTNGAKIDYTFAAKDVYIVAEAGMPIEIDVLVDGTSVGANGGADVASGSVTVQKSRLYHIYHNLTPGVHKLELIIKTPGLKVYTFTFG